MRRNNGVMLENKRPTGVSILSVGYFFAGIFTLFMAWFISAVLLPNGLMTARQIMPGIYYPIEVIPFTTAAFGIFAIILGYSMWSAKRIPSIIYSGYIFVVAIYNIVQGGALQVQQGDPLPIYTIVGGLGGLAVGAVVNRYLARNNVKEYLGRQ